MGMGESNGERSERNSAHYTHHFVLHLLTSFGRAPWPTAGGRRDEESRVTGRSPLLPSLRHPFGSVSLPTSFVLRSSTSLRSAEGMDRRDRVNEGRAKRGP